MPRKTKTPFAVGDFAFSPAHQQLVRVLSRKGRTVTLTRAIYPNEQPLAGTVKDKGLMTLKAFMDWAPTQPWYVTPRPSQSLREVVDNITRAHRPTG
jgi:hypothetical protein